MGEKYVIGIVIALFILEIILAYRFPKLFRYKRETVIGISLLGIIILVGIALVI